MAGRNAPSEFIFFRRYIDTCQFPATLFRLDLDYYFLCKPDAKE